METETSLYIQNIAYYALHLTSFFMENHSHNRCEIMYVTNGSCTVYVDNCPFVLNKNEFIFINKNIPHKLLITQQSPCSLLNYEFTSVAKNCGVEYCEVSFSSPAAIFFSKLNCAHAHLQDTSKLGYALKDLIQELEHSSYDKCLVELLTHRILIELEKCFLADASVLGIKHVKLACSYINENLFSPLCVQKIADYAMVNRSYLQVLFNKYCGCGIMNYVSNQRLERATFLLKNSSMAIVDIAFEVGFNSRQNFGHAFEKRYGVSPKQYRKLNQQSLFVDTGITQAIINEETKGFSHFEIV